MLSHTQTLRSKSTKRYPETKMKNLDTEALEILDAFDAGSLIPVADMTAEIKRHREASTATPQHPEPSDSTA